MVYFLLGEGGIFRKNPEEMTEVPDSAGFQEIGFWLHVYDSV
jgi:hypothetical protein